MNMRVENRLDSIIETLQARIEKAAAEGKRTLNVMEVPDLEYPEGFFGFSHRLRGVSKQVYEYCKKWGWRPKIEEYGYSGDGFQRIVIRW